MNGLTPTRVLNVLRGRARRLAQRESSTYWEDRALRYRSEVAPILDPADPYHAAQRLFLEKLREFGWTSILEVGCGFGWHLRALRQTFPDRRIAGLDFSFRQVQEARRYVDDGAVGLWQASGLQLPHPDRSFDVVFTSGMLVCLHPDRLAAALGELRRVSRQSVIAMEYAREHIDTPERVAIMRAAAWHGHLLADALAQAGMDVRESFPFPSFDSQTHRVPLGFFHAARGN
jgi:SAM-dependent methyltransferase